GNLTTSARPSGTPRYRHTACASCGWAVPLKIDRSRYMFGRPRREGCGVMPATKAGCIRAKNNAPVQLDTAAARYVAVPPAHIASVLALRRLEHQPAMPDLRLEPRTSTVVISVKNLDVVILPCDRLTTLRRRSPRARHSAPR